MKTKYRKNKYKKTEINSLKNKNKTIEKKRLTNLF